MTQLETSSVQRHQSMYPSNGPICQSSTNRWVTSLVLLISKNATATLCTTSTEHAEVTAALKLINVSQARTCVCDPYFWWVNNQSWLCGQMRERGWEWTWRIGQEETRRGEGSFEFGWTWLLQRWVICLAHGLLWATAASSWREKHVFQGQRKTKSNNSYLMCWSHVLIHPSVSLA